MDDEGNLSKRQGVINAKPKEKKGFIRGIFDKFVKNKKPERK